MVKSADRLRFEEIFATLPGGWLSEKEGWALWQAANRTEGPILEIGVYWGRSTVLLAHLERPMYCVDPFAGFAKKDYKGDIAEAKWRKNTEPFDNITLFKMHVEDWEPRPCGFCYLDGDHSFVGTKAQCDKAMACNPTIIAAHDVSSGGGGQHVKRACLKKLGKPATHNEKLATFNMKKVKK